LRAEPSTEFYVEAAPEVAPSLTVLRARGQTIDALAVVAPAV
jgi:hypothetical protein